VSPTRRLAVLVLAVGILAGTVWLLPLGAFPPLVARIGPLAPVVGVVVGAALLAALVPRTPVSLACGALFGAVNGTVCALLVALVAAAITFTAGRFLGREFVARRGGRRFAALESWISREGILAVAAVRALPIGPYGLSGYAYGASAVRVRDYAVGTLISATPSAVSYAMLGAAVVGANRPSPFTWVPLGFSLLLTAVVAYRAARSVRATPAKVRDPEPVGVG
jgi:uncharacterized membrane protein YdjX (TVP38/TMEM64 family)